MRKVPRKSEVGIKERLTLNPKLEEDDRKACEIALQDVNVKETLETAWYAVLKSGDCLKNERCDLKHFKVFAQECKYANSDRNTAAALRSYDVQMADDELIDFHGFVKCIFHLGMERFNISDYSISLAKMIEQFVVPWIHSFKARNEHDGTGPDETLLDLPEVDRILYIYDGVFERLFNRYKDRADHASRDLSLDQVRILDSLVELDEMRYLLQDFGFFPKFISHVEISKCSQFACFGRLTVDPTRLGAGHKSGIESEKKKEGLLAATIVSVGEEAPPEDESVVSNPLFLPSLPPEYMADEVLLDKPRFMCAMLRVAQALFGRAEYQKRLPSIPSRIEEFLNQAAPIYDKMFGRTMEQDCDFTEKGVPILNCDGPHAALVPPVGPMEGGFEVSLLGTNFCEKRGVFVRFGDHEDAVVVRSKQIQKKKVIVVAPPMKPTNTVVTVHFHHTYRIELIKETQVSVEASNNRWVYSITEPSQVLTFQMSLPGLELPEGISSKLLKFYSSVCAINDRYNTKFLYRDKWKSVKATYKLIEVSQAEDANDSFYLERAEYADGAKDLCLNFKSYLRVLSRTLFEMYGAAWSEELMKLADVSLQPQSKAAVVAPKYEEDDITQARRALELMERRSIIELDIFLGPVLCGSIAARPGDIVSKCTGKIVVHRKAHPYLSYEHHEINSESIILAHLRVSQSFPHLMNRLLNNGFDFSCRHSSPSVCKPAGRCWEIRWNEARIGAVWDYPGNYSNLEWQPAEQDMCHKTLSMAFYCKESEREFVQGYLIYTKATDIAHLRTLLAAKGFSLVTKLYKLP